MDVAEQVKDRISCADYIARTVTLHRNGSAQSGTCPFHSEKTGSLMVWTDHWFCFGCGQHGDLFTFYQLQHNCDFKESLRELAREANVELHPKPEDIAAYQKERSRAQLLGSAAGFYQRQLKDEHRDYLHKRGFNDDFITFYRFGFAPGTGLRQGIGSTSEQLLELGLVNHEGREFFSNRIIIPVYGRDDGIVNLVGRAWNSDDMGKKYLRLPGDGQLVNERGLRGTKVVWLCEGDTDTPTLVQAGLPAVGVPGTQALKEEYVAKFRNIETVYVCADADEAGRKLALRAGELLGNRCRIVCLPDGEDVNSFVGQKGGDIGALAKEARPFIDFLITMLPENVPADEIDKMLAPLFRAVRKVGRVSQEAYMRQIARRVSMSIASIKEAFRDLDLDAESNGKAQDPAGEYRIIWKEVRVINPAQDYYDGVMYTTAFLDVQVPDPETGEPKLKTVPYMVTSRRETFPLIDTEIYRRGLRIASTKIPLFTVIQRRWSIAAESPYSAKSYLDNGATVSPWEVYSEVASYFRQFVDYPNDLYYDFLALWTIGTYWFNLHQAYPYVHLTGSKRVGKSLTLKIIAELAFNALFTSSMSAAAAFRSVEASSATLLLDEAENLRKKKNEEATDDKIEILKSGYMKGPKAIRCTGDNHEPMGFDVYSPKIFGSIAGMDKILADRAVTLTLARKNRELPELDFVAVRAVMATTRDKLYVLMLEHAKDIIEQMASGIAWDGVRDRERELWTPILILARFFDEYHYADAGRVDKEELLTTKMRFLALQKVEEKLAKERAEQTEILILEGLMDYLKTATVIEKDDFYLASDVLGHLKMIEELSWLSRWQQIVRELERVTVIQSKRTDLRRLRINGKQVRAIRLDAERIQNVAERYGVEINATSN